MLRSANNRLLLLCAIIILCFGFASCGFIDLREINVVTEPQAGSVLPAADSPVILKFDTEMIKNDAEGILHISSASGQVNGDKYWKGNALYFSPVQGWTAGVCYTLSLAGTIRSVDGRELRIERFVSFYAVNKSSPPVLKNYSPADGASVSANNVIFEFEFSCSMDRLTTESALMIDGTGNKTFEWSFGGKKLRVITENNFSPWALYKWSIRDTAKSADGVPLAKTYSGCFLTDLDRSPPEVTRIFPVLNADGFWYPTGLDIETGLGQGHGIAVQFNKPMGESVIRSLRFEPSLPGRTEFLDKDSIVYIFSRNPEPDTIYTLTVSGDTKDSEGIKIGADFIINFTPDIPVLKILSVTAGGKEIDLSRSANNFTQITVDPAAGLLDLSIHFSLLSGFDEKQSMPQRISLSPFFPRSLPPAALQYVNWVSGDRLLMRWEGLKAGDDYPHYYKLTIPGGISGISSTPGIFMKENVTVSLEIIK